MFAGCLILLADTPQASRPSQAICVTMSDTLFFLQQNADTSLSCHKTITTITRISPCLLSAFNVTYILVRVLILDATWLDWCNMTLDAIAIIQIFNAEVSAIADAAIVNLIERFRVPPRLETRPWDYDAHGEYPCWFVIEDRAANIGVAYCQHGFGPKAPWGLLWLTGRRLSMGDDSGWFTSLAGAVREGW